jgi:hypothetical protein
MIRRSRHVVGGTRSPRAVVDNRVNVGQGLLEGHIGILGRSPRPRTLGFLRSISDVEEKLST